MAYIIYTLLQPNTYVRRVMRTNPIVYWPLDDVAGLVTRERMNGAHATYSAGITLANAPSPDGKPAPWFDGAAAMSSLNAAGRAILNAKFTGLAFTAMVWSKVNDASVWTDGGSRVAFSIYGDADNYTFPMYKYSTDDTIRNHTRFGAANSTIASTAFNNTAWNAYVVTYDDAADALTAYNNGVQYATQAFGTWDIAVPIAGLHIGRRSSAADYYWHGWLAHCALWNRILTPDEISDISIV